MRGSDSLRLSIEKSFNSHIGTVLRAVQLLEKLLVHFASQWDGHVWQLSIATIHAGGCWIFEISCEFDLLNNNARVSVPEYGDEPAAVPSGALVAFA